MNLKDILAVSGKPGLYKFISQGRNGVIVESFSDNKRMVVHSSNKVSALEDIAIFTETDEVPLKDVMGKIYEKETGAATMSHKSSNNELKDFFEEILPDYDKDRVYVSDIKKVINWYNILVDLNLLDPNDNGEEENKEDAKDSDSESAEVNTNEENTQEDNK